MNNFEKIKQMTVDEMSEFFIKNFSSICSFCPHQDKPIGYCREVDCDKEHTKGLKQYLLQEEQE